MKLYNKLATALMVLPLMAGLTACSDDKADYDPAEKLANAQVYFPTTNPSTLELALDGTTDTIQIARVNTEGELTVALSAVALDSVDILKVPTSVTFADGASTANIVVTYDPSQLEYDVYHRMDISLSDATIETPYGNSTYSFEYGIAAPWTPWCQTSKQFAAAGGDADAFPLGDEGTCTYTYEQFFSGDDEGLNVYFRQSTIDPNQGQFWIEHWGYDVDLIMDATWNEEYQVWLLSIPETYIGYDSEKYGAVYIADLATYQGLTPEDTKWWSYPSYYDPSCGQFVLDVIYYVEAGYFGYGEEDCQVDGFYVPDYSAELTYVGVLTDKSQATYACGDLTLGDDCHESADAIVVTQDDDPAAVADALVNDDITGMSVASGRIEVPFDYTELNSSKLRIVVATKDDEGAAADYAYADFEYYGGGDANPWKSLGIGQYTEGIVYGFYNVDQLTYDVEILENQDEPGMYRLVDPYGENWAYADYNNMTPCDYLEINATDPDGVYILPQMLGLQLESGDTELGYATYAGYIISTGQADVETLKGYGYTGVLKNGVIEFPTFQSSDDPTASDYYTFQGVVYYGSSTAYYGGCDMMITLPDATTKAQRAANASAYNRTMKSLRRPTRVARHDMAKNFKVAKKMQAPLHKLHKMAIK